MPGFEVFGEDERKAINDLFDANGGILFAHGFDAMRKGIYRVREFEKAFASRMGSQYAQAVSSGSAAVKIGLISSGVVSGDEVIVPAFTFIATIEAILEVGAVPVIVDIDDTLNISPCAFEAAITPKTRAVVPVHMLGAPAEMDQIMAIAARHNFIVMEDNAQGCGGSYKGKLLGTIGCAGSFSLDAGKTIMTGEGGMVVTRDKEIYVRSRAFHDHGHEYSTSVGRGQEAALMVGFNYRMTELQGAIGIVQLKKLDMILDAQRRNKRKLKAMLADLPLVFRRILDEEGELADTIVFFLESKDQATQFAQRMGQEGLGTKNLPDALNWHFAGRWEHMRDRLPGSSEPWQARWSKSSDLLERAIALPVMVKMSDQQITEVGEKLRKIAKEVL
jgi:8-amino-3,8-dideoxy-alpha-D-manno-octulosonate transaminase